MNIHFLNLYLSENLPLCLPPGLLPANVHPCQDRSRPLRVPGKVIFFIHINPILTSAT